MKIVYQVKIGLAREDSVEINAGTLNNIMRNFTIANIALHDNDVENDGKLKPETKQNLEALKISKEGIIEIETASRASKQLIEECNTFLKYPYLLKEEREFIKDRKKKLKEYMPTIGKIDSFNYMINHNRTMTISKSEWFKRFIQKCKDVCAAFITKGKSVKETFKTATKSRVDRMNELKAKVKNLINTLTKEKAEHLFRNKFVDSLNSRERINEMISRQELVKENDKGLTLDELENKKAFDSSGNRSADSCIPDNVMNRINNNLRFLVDISSLSDKKKIILSSAIFAVRKELSDEINKSVNHEDPEFYEKVCLNRALTEICKNDEDVKDILRTFDLPKALSAASEEVNTNPRPRMS